jgi:pyridoxine kinase
LTRDNQTVPSRPVSKAGTGTHTPSDAQTHDAATQPLSAWEQLSKPQLGDDKDNDTEKLTIIGSTATSDYKPRLFRIDTPQLPLFFSGTGDMFAALTIPRLIEAVHAASTPDFDLHAVPSWRSPDDVGATELPLAKACQKVLASMQAILSKTTESCLRKMAAYDERVGATQGRGTGDEAEQEALKKRHLALMNASEVTVVRYVKELLDPPDVERFAPKAVFVGE